MGQCPSFFICFESDENQKEIYRSGHQIGHCHCGLLVHCSKASTEKRRRRPSSGYDRPDGLSQPGLLHSLTRYDADQLDVGVLQMEIAHDGN